MQIFTEQGGYWFAMILFRRYIRNGARLVYSLKAGRFATRIGGKVYDINGDATREDAWVLWDEFDEEPTRSEVIRMKMFLLL